MGLVGSGSPGQDVKRVIPQLREPLHPGYRYNLLLDLINPRRACAARVTVVVLCVCVSVCVCVCVYDYSRTTGYEAAYERYQQLQCYKGKKNNVAILLKPLRSGDMA